MSPGPEIFISSPGKEIKALTFYNTSKIATGNIYEKKKTIYLDLHCPSLLYMILSENFVLEDYGWGTVRWQ